MPTSAKGYSHSKSPRTPKKDVMMNVVAGIGKSIQKILEAPERLSGSRMNQNNSHEQLHNAIQVLKDQYIGLLSEAEYVGRLTLLEKD
ncbi:hypothetical protein O181_042121 [Austropuccinia psidii MF-1]|uniref:Uncharacterized protein n=1 Tax=Austropuccinia psidii MF-1 TaxID=1389203 RepID=A0A9Q3HEU9_9BASI|nr:hypothetical protein [Austropuccinia psidii MF-1]